MLNWKTSKEDHDIIVTIAERYIYLLKTADIPIPKKLDLIMDIEAVHNNGCPLNLDDLLNASDDDFAHDLIGIQVNLNRKTGKLENCFVPRYNKKERS
jgi:hypothetical protein